MAQEAEKSPKGDHKKSRIRIRSRRRPAPLILYYDTSALIKLLIPEEGSELAERLWASAYPAVASILAYPEGRAALGLSLRQGRLDHRAYGRSLVEFEDLHEELISLGVDAQLARAAGQYATDFGLRGCDSVHLATAMDFGEDELVFVTWDEALGKAAESAGLPIAGAVGW